MAQSHSRPRSAKGITPARSVRITDEVWETAKRRAAYEGTTVSHVIASLLEGYSKGLLDLPRVRVQYSPPREDASTG